jgi:hypothetical protein
MGTHFAKEQNWYDKHRDHDISLLNPGSDVVYQEIRYDTVQGGKRLVDAGTGWVEDEFNQAKGGLEKALLIGGVVLLVIMLKK